jgi:hypothetical protein
MAIGHLQDGHAAAAISFMTGTRSLHDDSVAEPLDRKSSISYISCQRGPMTDRFPLSASFARVHRRRAPIRESASAKESVCDSCLTAPLREYSREIIGLTGVAPAGVAADPCLTASIGVAGRTISALPASAAHGASPDRPEKASSSKGLWRVRPDSRPPRIAEAVSAGAAFPAVALAL